MELNRVYEMLKEIVETPSPPGYGEQAMEVIKKYMSKYAAKVEIDVLGNVVGIIGNGDFKIMFSAHYDQIGFIVRDITDKGEIYFAPCGGWDARIVYGYRVIIHSKNGPVKGVIATKPIHFRGLMPEEFKKAPEIRDMVIDVGASSRKEVEDMGISIGDSITLDAPVIRLGRKDLVAGAGLDDKACVTSLILAMEELSKETPDNVSVYFVASMQEELGARGARVAAYRINPKIGIAADVTHAKMPLIDPKITGLIELGKGPAIGIGPNFHRLVWESLIKIAKEENIPYQLEPIPGPSGTDANVIQITREGIYTGLVSLPLRYMHSAAEVISLNDVINLGKLIAAFVKKVDLELFK